MGRKQNLRRLMQNDRGWSTDELVATYRSFGFNVTQASKHVKVSHERLAWSDIVPRGKRELLPVYPRQALKSIQAVLALSSESDHEQ